VVVVTFVAAAVAQMLNGYYASRPDTANQVILAGLPDPTQPDPNTAGTGMLFVGGGGGGNVTAYGWDASGCMAFTAQLPVQNLCVGPGYEQNITYGAITIGLASTAQTLWGWTSTYGEPVWVDSNCVPVRARATRSRLRQWQRLPR